jgi:hypothetical protein
VGGISSAADQGVALCEFSTPYALSVTTLGLLMLISARCDAGSVVRMAAMTVAILCAGLPFVTCCGLGLQLLYRTSSRKASFQ